MAAYRNKKTSLDHFREAFREIRSGNSISPIYYFHGEESFFMDLLQDEVEKLVPAEQKDFNFDLVYGADSSPARVIDMARSFPMMADRRVVIVRDFMKLGEKTEDGNLNDFEAYLSNPNPSTVLCLIDKKIPDGRTKLGKALTSKESPASVYQFEPVPDNLLPDWVADWAKHAHRKVIEPEAARTLAQMVGQDLQLLSTEIDKVCTFVDTRDRVSIDDIKKISGSYREFNVFELKNAVVSRNLDRAYAIAEQMLQQTNNSTGEVFKTVGFFYNVFGNIWQISRLRDSGHSKDQVQTMLGTKNNYIFNAQWTEASKFSSGEIPQIFEALLDADRAAKGFSTLDTPSILLLMLKRIIG